MWTASQQLSEKRTTMKIEIINPMLDALRRGMDSYTPVFDGVDLELEHGDPAVSWRNLEKIIGPDRKIIRFFLLKGMALAIFDTGETYLATGFLYGHENDEQKVRQFALFASNQGFGDIEILASHLSALSISHFGPMEPEQPEPERPNGRFGVVSE